MHPQEQLPTVKRCIAPCFRCALWHPQVYYTDDVSLSRADAENQVAITNSALRRAGAGFELVLLRFERVGAASSGPDRRDVPYRAV